MRSGRLFAIAFILIVSSAFADDDGQLYDFNVPETAIATAINLIAKQSGIPAIFPYDQVSERTANGLKGTYTLQEALDRVLENTGLAAEITTQDVIVVVDEPNAENQERTVKGKSAKDVLRGSAVAVAAATLPLAAGAQDQPEPDERAVASLVEEVVVTGSRLRRSAIESPTPVVSLDASAIEKSGATILGELLTELPALGTSYTLANRSGPSSAFFAPGSAGLHLLDLRSLGPNRTLMLVNGRRRVASSPGSTAVDVNIVPVDWVDRIEVITGGATAIYGADAVAGAVNFVLKDEIVGTNFRGNFLTALDNPYETLSLSASHGLKFADGRGNFAIGVEYAEQNLVTAKSRDETATPHTYVANPANGDTNGMHDGVPDLILVPNAGWPGNNVRGVTSIGGVSYVFEPDGTPRPRLTGTQYGPFCADCEFSDFLATFDLQPDYERFNVHARASYDLNDEHRLSFNASYTDAEVAAKQQAPYEFPRLIIQRDNAFITPELGALMDANGLTRLVMNRSNIDFGRMGENTTRETLSLNVELDGDLTERFRYSVYAGWGNTDINFARSNDRIQARWYAATDAVVDPGTGQIVCRATIDPDATLNGGTTPVPDSARSGCVPTSVFGQGVVSPAAADWARTDSMIDSELRQFILSADIRTDSLFTLPAGDVAMVVGAEYRKEESETNPEAQVIAGETFLGSVERIEGSYDASDLFAEMSIPLLGERQMAKDLTLDLAGRFSTYDTIDNTFAWKAGLNWAMTDAIRFRGTLAEAVRAPNITELFSPQSTLNFNIKDPCSESRLENAEDPELREMNCRDLGIPDGYESQLDVTSVRGLRGGNPNLREESADTVTYGVIFTPEIGNLSSIAISLDYWSIEVVDAIGNVGAQTILDQCVDSLVGVDNDLCRAVTRDPASSEITSIQQVVQNLQAIETEGYDAEVRYSTPLGDGQLNLRALLTYVDKYDLRPFQVSPENVVDQAGTGSNPELSGVFDANYDINDWSFGYEARYVDSVVRFSNSLLRANPDYADVTHTGTIVYHDIVAQRTFGDNLVLRFGVDNLTDEAPPIAIDRMSYLSRGQFDLLGRKFFVGASYDF